MSIAMASRALLLRNLSAAIVLFVVISQSTLSRISYELYLLESAAQSPAMKDSFRGVRLWKPIMKAPGKDQGKSNEKAISIESELTVRARRAPAEFARPDAKFNGAAEDDASTMPAVHEATNTAADKVDIFRASYDSKLNDQKDIVDFEKQEGAVIVTKVHGMRHWQMLEQMLCLLHQAYNKRVQYDILIFTTEVVPEEDIEYMRNVVSPAKFTVALESNMTLHERVNSFTPEQRAALLKRCNVTTVEEMNWYTRCDEYGLSLERLMYTWQAEFRSLHIWSHPALAPYKYMLWMDTDAFCTRPWQQDPIATAMRNNLAIFFMNFPAGMARGPRFVDRYHQAFNTTLCWVYLKDGHLAAHTGEDCRNPQVHLVHGFFHVTNLDFYRSPPVMHWARTLIGNATFSRMFDDQLAVTAPAAIYAPERSWDMHSHNVTLDVYHNSHLDGKRNYGVGGFMRYYKNHVKTTLPDSVGTCKIVAANR